MSEANEDAKKPHARSDIESASEARRRRFESPLSASGAEARAITAHSFETRDRRVCRLRQEASKVGKERVKEDTSVEESDSRKELLLASLSSSSFSSVSVPFLRFAIARTSGSSALIASAISSSAARASAAAARLVCAMICMNAHAPSSEEAAPSPPFRKSEARPVTDIASAARAMGSRRNGNKSRAAPFAGFEPRTAAKNLAASGKADSLRRRRDSASTT